MQSILCNKDGDSVDEGETDDVGVTDDEGVTVDVGVTDDEGVTDDVGVTVDKGVTGDVGSGDGADVGACELPEVDITV